MFTLTNVEKKSMYSDEVAHISYFNKFVSVQESSPKRFRHILEQVEPKETQLPRNE